MRHWAHSGPIARSGARVTGVDIAPQMLARAAERIAREAPEVRKCVRDLVRGDIRELDLDGHFSLVTAPFRLLQFVTTVTEQLRFLCAVHELLTSEGRFVFDVFDFSVLDAPVVGVEFGDEPPFVLPDGRAITRRKQVTAWDAPSQVLRTQSIFDIEAPGDPTPKRLVQEHEVRYLFRFELEHMLARAGFFIEELSCDFRGTPYGTRYPGEIVVIARRG
jgi:hypothetical protein